MNGGAPLWVQIAFALAWVVAYVRWARVYFRRIDPALRRALGGWAGEPIHWVLRRGRQRGGDFLSPRYDTWSWGLAPRDDAPLAKDWSLYVVSVLLVYVVAALWPVAVLYAAAFKLRLLSPLFVLVLFFAVIPLYLRFWSGRWHAEERSRGGASVHPG